MFDFNAPRGYERINGTAYFYGRTQRMDILKTILSNGAVWGALFALLVLIARTYFPQIPENIIDAALLLATVILGAVGVYGVGARAGYIKAQTERE